jgi:S-adenosylmethionine hydrolase
MSVHRSGRTLPPSASSRRGGGAAAIVDSQGYLALVVNHGSAAQTLNLKAGSAVVLE